MSAKEEIAALDSKVTRLKVEYEQYFMRAIKREPARLRKEIDGLIRKYSTVSLTNTSLKFKLNSISARYNSYKQYWTRVLRSIEEGTYVRTAEGGSGTMATPVGAPALTQESAPEPGDGAQDEMNTLFDEYLGARKECGESVKGLTREILARTLDKQLEKLRSKYGEREVEFKVAVKNGKTRLVVKPKK